MSKYVITKTQADPTIDCGDRKKLHYNDGETAAKCGANGEFQEASGGEVESLPLCQHCESNHRPRPSNPRDAVLIYTRDGWWSAPKLAEQTRFSASILREKALALHQEGVLQRRESVKRTDGSHALVYSQQEREQATYQGNNQLFESMLADD